MKILACLQRDDTKYTYIELCDKKRIKMVSRLLRERRYGRIIGLIKEEKGLIDDITEDEKAIIKADLILTETNAHWEVMP